MFLPSAKLTLFFVTKNHCEFFCQPQYTIYASLFCLLEISKTEMSDVLILDTGADTIKIGYGNESAPKKFPNMIYKTKNNSRLFVSSEIETCRNKSALFYLSPKENGYTVNWDVQRTIYEHVFYESLNLNCSELAAVVTEPEMDPIANQRTIDELFFEDYGFKAIYRNCFSLHSLARKIEHLEKLQKGAITPTLYLHAIMQ